MIAESLLTCHCLISPKYKNKMKQKQKQLLYAASIKQDIQYNTLIVSLAAFVSVSFGKSLFKLLLQYSKPSRIASPRSHQKFGQVAEAYVVCRELAQKKQEMVAFMDDARCS